MSDKGENSEIRCPHCNSRNFIYDYDRAEIVCSVCGSVIDDKLMDPGPEWRAFDDEQRERRTRVGAPITYAIHDKGLSTIVDIKPRSGLPISKISQFMNLRRLQNRSRLSTARDRNLALALRTIMEIISALNLPKSVLETASVVYRKALENNKVKGRSIKSMAAAAVYLACHLCKHARTLDELSKISMMDKKEIGRSYRSLIKDLTITVTPIPPHSYVKHIAKPLQLPASAELIAYRIVEVARSIRITNGKNPTGIAAAALYMASIISGYKKTQREIAEAANVTEVTVRNRYANLAREIQVDIYV